MDINGNLDIAGQNVYLNSSKPYVYENLALSIVIPPSAPQVDHDDVIMAPFIYLLMEKEN